MPRLRMHTAAIGGVGPKEAMISEVRREPLVQAYERPPGELLHGELRAVIGRHRRPVDDVEIAAPVVTAGAWQGGPDEDRADAGELVQARRFERPPGPVEHGALAAEFGV